MKNRGQVWIETVLYTLIGLTLMGLVLGFVMPKINETKDRALIEQAINSLSDLDAKISNVIQTGPGNVRQTEFLMKKGEFYVNASADRIEMVLNVAKPYSEPNITVYIGKIKVLSEVGQKTSRVYIRADYKDYNINITYNEEEDEKKFTAAPTPYKFFIENRAAANTPGWININEISNR